MGALVPPAWDAGFSQPRSSFPPGWAPSRPGHPAIPNVGSPGTWDGLMTPCPRVGGWGSERPQSSLGGWCAAHGRARNPSPVPGQPPQRAALSSDGFWLCGCLQTQPALVAALRDSRWLLVSVVRLGSWLVFPCCRKDHLLQPALALPCEWRTLRFLQQFTSVEACFALSNYTAWKFSFYCLVISTLLDWQDLQIPCYPLFTLYFLH